MVGMGDDIIGERPHFVDELHRNQRIEQTIREGREHRRAQERKVTQEILEKTVEHEGENNE